MNYKESITALLEGLKGIFENKTATEASAIAQAATKPSTIFYTSDTHAIVVGGHVYGRSNQVSADAPFAYLPANVSSPAADPQFDGNHDTIYIQPIKTGADAGKIKLWWYVNGAWTSSDTLDLVLPTDAEDITYDLTNTPDLGSGDVQSAIEALDGKVEDLRDEVLGDEWVDMMYGCYGAELWRSAQLSSKNLVYNTNYRCLIFKVEAGDEFRLRGMSCVQSGGGQYYCWAVYDTFPSDMATRTSLESYFMTCGTLYNTGTYGIDDDVTIPTGGKMLVVMSQYNGNYWDDLRIYKHSTTPLSIADKTGYKIDTWTDDEIITSTTLAVGSIMPSWSDGTRYGCRGVRLNVKEGDKILLDTYSPALFGLIFTDENRVVKALYNDRRFDGVWTAPCDGYCYIQDVLYRDNFHYSSAHGHLAYMAHDARKRVTKGGDWYNEYAPRILGDSLIEFSVTTNISARVTAIGGNKTNYCQTTRKQGTFSLIAYHIHIYADTTSEGTVSNQRFDSSSTRTNYLNVPFLSGVEQDLWSYAIVVNTAASSASYALAIDVTATTAGLTHLKIDKVFLHSSYDFAELYALAQKIINGEVEVDNFYGVKEKEVDLVKNAIGLQSISDLGYNILEHGATLPIDEEGYKYAKEIYDRYKDNPPRSAKEFQTQFRNDLNLVYFPHIDLSHMSGVATDLLISSFLNCKNLIACSELIFGDDAPANSNAFNGTFNGCYSLKAFKGVKMVNDNGISMYQCFTNCYSLEYVGILDLYVSSISLCFQNCYSLERIEEIRVKKLVGFSSASFSNCTNLHFMLMKNIGHSTAVTNWYYPALTVWGIPNDKHPDARQSLVDSLLTYSYDRVNDPDELGTAGTTCTITLSANSYAQLTASEIEVITAKGYTLTHP